MTEKLFKFYRFVTVTGWSLIIIGAQLCFFRTLKLLPLLLNAVELSTREFFELVFCAAAYCDYIIAMVTDVPYRSLKKYGVDFISTRELLFGGEDEDAE